MKDTKYHTPVMVEEVLEYLQPKAGKTYLDVTFGGGGHTKSILDANEECNVIGLDWDLNSIDKQGEKLEEVYGDRLHLLWGNFAQLYRIFKKAGIKKVDGILADFGTSMFQIKNRPGFSFSTETFLDMRMSPSHQKVTAAEVLSRSDEKTLKEIFLKYGEEHQAAKVASLIVEERKKRSIKTTKQLVEIVEKVIPRYKRTIHPATKVFQALRIFVNSELDNISSFLSSVPRFLNPNGRLVCISFHSLEDRLVKQFLKSQKELLAEKINILTPRVVVPTEEEIKRNPPSRSAKFRAAEFL
ncbi:16S rRNA (cytosine(1402)-N(4))-methyltransferase RsmH [bacterium]|jgi:16S rRNA (cytosine1402-N4)-methyltransferase|nr:16S rRNA (cytosine(1402)-N(4))-methyltransferase RsmH [bacterium]